MNEHLIDAPSFEAYREAKPIWIGPWTTSAIQTRIAAAKQRLERCAPEDRAEYRAELEDTRQRLRWAEVVLIEARGEADICSEELAEELARQGLSQEGQT